MTIDLIRGDRADIDISDLLDGNDTPTTFGVDDVLRWTAKRYVGQPDSAALFAKSSPSGGISIAVGFDTATISVLPADWNDLSVANDLRFVWDLQLAPAGDAARIVTVAAGEGIIHADVTVAAP